MKKMLLIFITLFLFGCQDTNSNSDDKIKYGPIEITETDPNFLAAYKVIQNRCVNCHTSSIHNHWAGLISNDDWLSQYVIVKNRPDLSALIQRIINSGAPSSNMPIGGSALPANEYQALTKWVTEIP